jgi:phosphomannomutase
MNDASLKANLQYEPQVLKFGTSGRRGKVADLTQLEIYINALAELEYLQTRPAADGGITKGDEFYFAHDQRPSSTCFDRDQQGRGEIAQAIERAITDGGMQTVNLGAIPTPALAFYALQQKRGCMMITGSHVPFDRNGYKTYSSKGELLKADEGPINERVGLVRQRLYEQPYTVSIFDRSGSFKSGHQELGAARAEARTAYLRRYREFFSGLTLRGKRLLVYQHSAVGRDLLVEILQQLGAEVIPAGRSETFISIDTENIDEQQLADIQALADEAWKRHGPIDAVVSTDGDSDRPLILGAEAVTDAAPTQACRVRFFGGDLVGMVVAEYLGADAVVVPISCNDALDRGPLKDRVEPKTRIGSPYVIAGMEQARLKGRRAVCGWEANGGFLVGSDIHRNGQVLRALPTRDAFLPILGVLFSMLTQRLSLAELFDQLPKRFSRAALLRNFPRALSQRIVARFSPADEKVKEVIFGSAGVTLLDEERREVPPSPGLVAQVLTIRESLSRFFDTSGGFTGIARLNYTDGVRVYFSNGEVAHVRPSGNADELRIYAVADSQSRADAVAKLGVAEPNGILRRLAPVQDSPIQREL